MRSVNSLLFSLIVSVTLQGLNHRLLEEMATWTFDYTLTSTVRSVTDNILVGGSENSQHLQGNAVDFVVHGVEPEEIYDLLDKKYPNSKGIGLYKYHIHFDVREEKARWKNLE